MTKTILIDAHYDDETRVAVVNDSGALENFEVEYSNRRPIKGNIYLAKIIRVEPSIQAAFIEYGAEVQGFLPFSEIGNEYFECDHKSSDNETAPSAKTAAYLRRQGNNLMNQTVLVQAVKERRGNKRPYFTTFISIIGRYCILSPNPHKDRSVGISKKIIDEPERARLRELVDSIPVPDGMNCVVRTAGENRTKQDLKRDLEYLLRLWNEIKKSSLKSEARAMIYEEGNIIRRTIRDSYKGTVDKVIVQGEEAYKEAKTFMKLFISSHLRKVEQYKDNAVPIFHKYEIENQITQILDPVVYLPSGGSIVIDKTEALTAIDVNSGKIKGERSMDEMILKTNLEASTEIARQIMLRDISGIIVVDFIDMENQADVNKIEKTVKDALSHDSAHTTIGKMSGLGLLEISRQRMRTSFPENNLVQCPHCNGFGKVLSEESVALSVIRKIEKFLVDKRPKSLIVECASGTDLFILNRKRRNIAELESSYKVSIEITRGWSLKGDECNIFDRSSEQEEHTKVANKATANGASNAKPTAGVRTDVSPRDYQKEITQKRGWLRKIFR
jgi:ribonuclease E